jgi:hypothetical protein
MARLWRKLTGKPAGVRAREVFYFFVYPALRPLVRGRHFALAEEHIPYGNQRKNLMLATERAVEVPIVMEELARQRGGRVLEIGNVLGQYVDGADWDVVDKYETAPGVISVDILDFHPAEKYDFIFSISTIEHIGFNEPVRDASKLERALQHMRENLLAAGGLMLVTFPLGWNPNLDTAFQRGELEFDEVAVLRRVGWANKWEQVAREKADYVYGRFIGADCVVVAKHKKMLPEGANKMQKTPRGQS